MRAARLLWLLVFLGTTLTGLPACGLQSDAIVVIALHPQNPNILYIATNDYIYKSRDEGKSWEAISRGMTHSRVIAMAIDPAYPAIVYAGTKGDAVYKSYDGGQRWVSQRTGLDDVTVTSVVNQIVFDPRDIDTRPPPARQDAPLPVTPLFAATTMGVFESEDGGEMWTKRMNGMKEVRMGVTLANDRAR